MAMPQRDDPPSRCALRRTSTTEAIERLDASLMSMRSCIVTRKRPSASAKSCAGRRMKFDGRWRLKIAAVWYNFNVRARSEDEKT